MHDDRPSEPEGESLPAPPASYRGYEPTGPGRPQRGGWRTAGGVVGAAGLLLAKFKTLALVLVNLKWLVFVPKLLFGFGGLFVSIWVYALFFGWKFGIVFVLLILVHELGHYLTFRNFGIAANLPFFIPGFGAFVATRGPAPSLTIEAIATLAGPVFGVAASAVCFFYGTTTHEPFWIAAAYVGFFLNALNLLPVPPLDGGGIANAIDPRLWILGLVAFIVVIALLGTFSAFTFIMIALIALTGVPRIIGLFRGRVDPRLHDVPIASRWAIAAAYFAVVVIAVVGAVAAHIDTQSLRVGA